MKKTKPTKRRPLTLKKETLRKLADKDARVQGGTVTGTALCPRSLFFCPTVALCGRLSQGRPCPPGSWGWC